MKLVLIILLFSFKAQAYDLNKDTVVSGIWDLNGDILNIIKGKITGGGTIKRANIVANLYTQIFDTSITLVNCRTREFSNMWYGVRANKADSYWEFQKSINTCIANNIKNLYSPDNCNISLPLKVFKLGIDNAYNDVNLNVYGDADMWDENHSTIICTRKDVFAFGFQRAKGGSFHHIKLQGQWVPPVKVIPDYYSIPENQFLDRNGQCPIGEYKGLVIDWDDSRDRSGSTALKVHDISVTGFDVLISVSPTGNTANADLLEFENIQFGHGRRGFESGQPQEKGNRLINISSWGFIHTLINIGVHFGGAGNYTIDGGNIAGSCIRLFNINQQGWFPTNISNLYAESVGRIGRLATGDNNYKQPITVHNLIVDFAIQSEAGKIKLIDVPTYNVNFYNCTFRYYGRPQDTLWWDGYGNYQNCIWSSPKKGMINSYIINYPVPPIVAPKVRIQKR